VVRPTKEAGQTSVVMVMVMMTEMVMVMMAVVAYV
jgi:hypothetical protein